jgi:hypothetical protein
MKNTILKSLVATTLIATAFAASNDPFAAFLKAPTKPVATTSTTVADPFAAFLTVAPKKAVVDVVTKADHETAMQQLQDAHAAALNGKTLIATTDLLDTDINQHNALVLADAVTNKTHHTDADMVTLQGQATAALTRLQSDLQAVTDEKDALLPLANLAKRLVKAGALRDTLNAMAQTVGYADNDIDAAIVNNFGGNIKVFAEARKAVDGSEDDAAANFLAALELYELAIS